MIQPLRPLPAELWRHVGSERYYRERHCDFAHRHPGARPPRYYLDYGSKYHLRFRQLQPRLSAEGRQWVDRTATLLQLMLEEQRARDPVGFDTLERDGRALQRFIYRTHARAYIAAGLTRLRPEDLLLVLTTPDRRDLLERHALREVLKAGFTVGRSRRLRGNLELALEAASMFWREVATRPTPRDRSRRPWSMYQSWRSLLFASWRLRPSVIRPLIPGELELDTYQGAAWISLVSLQMDGVRLARPEAAALPGFAQLNLRTYVRRGGKPGVYFLSIDCAQHLVSLAARLLFRLPYRPARLSFLQDDEQYAFVSQRLGSSRTPAVYRCRYRPVGPLFQASPGSVEAFLVERGALFTVDLLSRRVRRGDVHHEPWPLRKAVVAIEANSVLAAAGLPAERAPDHVVFSPGVDTEAAPFSREP